MTVDIDHLSFTVKDDGYGIDPNDLAKVATLNHTSKLKSLNKLKQITTFGFRGQALHSIAAISSMVVVSKTKDYSASFSTSINYSTMLFSPHMVNEDSLYYSELPKYHGTMVCVKNLFSNVPVRQAQVKKEPEYKILEEIRRIVLQCSISKSNVKMTVYKKSYISRKMICKIDQTSSGTIHERILKLMNSIYGISLENNHQYLETSYQDYRVTGVIGKIPVQSKSYQFLLWNNRFLCNADLFKEINKVFFATGFGSQSSILVPSVSRVDTSPKKGRSPTKSASSVGSPYSKYPTFIIVVTGPISVSDLIQNPAKNIEVSKHLDVIVPLIIKVIKSFLKVNHYNVGMIKTPKLSLDEEIKPIPKRARLNNELYTKPEIGLVLNSKLKMGKLNQKEVSGMLSTKPELKPSSSLTSSSTIRELIKSNRKHTFLQHYSCANHKHSSDEDNHELTPVKNLNISRETLETCQVISQVDTKFILVKINKPSPRLLTIDQHACDERIKVEQWLKRFLEAAQDPFNDLGISLDKDQFEMSLNKMELALLHQYKHQCEYWGIKFQIEDSKVTITHLPDILIPKLDGDQEFIKKCLNQYLYDLHNKVKLKSLSNDWWSSIQALPTILIDLLNSKACRSAIMFGRVLTKNECEEMIKSLSKCRQPFQCAHGRPSIVPLCELSDI